MARTHTEAIFNKLCKSELFQLLLNTEANMTAHIATLTAEIQEINKDLKKTRSRCCGH